MVNRILLVFDDDQWNSIQATKKRTGKKWEDFVILGAKCLDKQLEKAKKVTKKESSV